MSATLQGTRNGIEAAWAPGAFSGVAESIAAKDLTNLYRTSCFFREEDR
jgi:phosphate-selective porin